MEALGRLSALDLACSLLPAPDKASQTQGRKGGHKSRRNAGAAGLSKHISDTSQVSLLQVYFSSAFSQKVSRKQLRGSFINVSLPSPPHRRCRLLFLVLHPEMVRRWCRHALLPVRCRQREVAAEGSPHAHLGARLLKVSGGDIFDPGPANSLSWTPVMLRF